MLWNERDIKLAKISVQTSLNRYRNLDSQSFPSSPELYGKLQAEIEGLTATLDKLNQGIIRIAAFGLVSRGKSAVLNALLGEKILQTGPLNGVTQWPRSVQWVIENGEEKPIVIELIDTPGLDEVAGEVRGEISKEITRQTDLILFVVSADITRTEYDALCELRQSHKPLILVFNKIDLYPDMERQAISENLARLSQGVKNPEIELINPDEIVRVAADPAPQQVRIEWPDGKISYEWEKPPIQIESLKQKILTILAEDGGSLLALNALVQAKATETKISHYLLKLRQREADDLIWKFAQAKALTIAINPLGILDVLGAPLADLLLIRSLARLYGLPMTGYEAGKLWKTILVGAGGLLLGELGSLLILSVGKTGIGLFHDLTNYAGIAVLQASLAAYGTYAVGRAAQVYLEKGCTWGAYGQDTVIQAILKQVRPDTVLGRLK